MPDLMTFLPTHPTLTSLLAIVLILLTIVELLRLKHRHAQINIPTAVQLINREGAVVIDIRSNDLFQKGHIIDSQSLPEKEIQTNLKKIEKFRSKPIILVCHAGHESQKIAALLVKQGYNIHSLSGGMRAWMAAELPLIKE